MAESLGALVGRVLIQIGDSEPVEVGTIEINQVTVPAYVVDGTGRTTAVVHIDGVDSETISKKINDQLTINDRLTISDNAS